MYRRLLYVSVSALAKDVAAQEVAAILEGAVIRNRKHGVQGSLIFSGTRFAQYLEGARDSLDPIVASILADSRHHSVTVLLDEENGHCRVSSAPLSYSGPSVYLEKLIGELIGVNPDEIMTKLNTGKLLKIITALSYPRRI